MKQFFLFHALILLENRCSAFVPHFHINLSPRVKSTRIFSDDPGDGDKMLINSGRKEIGYDSNSGGFFETGDSKDCVPTDEYCAVDNATGKLVRLTVEEKERIFLDSLQSYYFDGRQLLKDDEFDILKEDLEWNGSPLVQLNRKEAKYLSAMQAYSKGTPIMDDEQFDSLKSELKDEKSKFAVSKEPKCYIDTGICTVTLEKDTFRNNLLYLPVGALLFIAWLGIGFEIIEKIVRINPLLLIILGAYPIYKGTEIITNEYIFTNNKIAYGPCPACEAENRVYFGDILGVKGYDGIADVKCKKCKAKFKVQKDTLRASTLPKKN